MNEKYKAPDEFEKFLTQSAPAVPKIQEFEKQAVRNRLRDHELRKLQNRQKQIWALGLAAAASLILVFYLESPESSSDEVYAFLAEDLYAPELETYSLLDEEGLGEFE